MNQEVNKQKNIQLNLEFGMRAVRLRAKAYRLSSCDFDTLLTTFSWFVFFIIISCCC